MPKHYVLFGQIHVHKVNGKTLDKDTVARYDASSPEEGRAKAEEMFGLEFSRDCHKDFPEDKLWHFPKGYVDL
jgi:hypothetical protein